MRALIGAPLSDVDRLRESFEAQQKQIDQLAVWMKETIEQHAALVAVVEHHGNTLIELLKVKGFV